MNVSANNTGRLDFAQMPRHGKTARFGHLSRWCVYLFTDFRASGGTNTQFDFSISPEICEFCEPYWLFAVSLCVDFPLQRLPTAPATPSMSVKWGA